MYQGNWTCSSCGGSITELPFEPKSDKGLTCRACFAKQKEAKKENGGAGNGNAAGGNGNGERKTHEGNWKCSECGSAITSLPFEPRGTNNLRCVDCFKKTQA